MKLKVETDSTLNTFSFYDEEGKKRIEWKVPEYEFSPICRRLLTLKQYETVIADKDIRVKVTNERFKQAVLYKKQKGL